MALAKKSKKCYICDEILPAGAVPLCKATRNRELTEKKSSTAGSIVLSDLLRSVGIGICNAASEESKSACKKCARKIFNCCTMFHELESAVKARIDEGNSESTEGRIKRLHGNSPSGSTDTFNLLCLKRLYWEIFQSLCQRPRKLLLAHCTFGHFDNPDRKKGRLTSSQSEWSFSEVLLPIRKKSRIWHFYMWSIIEMYHALFPWETYRDNRERAWSQASHVFSLKSP